MKKQPIVFATIFILLTLAFFLAINHFQLFTAILPSATTLSQLKEEVLPKPTQIMSDGLPDRYLIKTTFVPQAPEKNWDQPWQDACEEAALLTVNYYYLSQKPDTAQIVSDLQSILSYESDNNLSHDVNLAQLATISSALFNFKSQIITNPDIQTLKTILVSNTPIIVPANGKTLFKENKHFKSGGPWYHYLVILGYDQAKQQFIVHDVGTQFGSYFRYSYQTLLSSIHDFPPSGQKEDIDSGEKKVLVLLK